MPKEMKYGTTRRFSRVVFLSLVTLGIYYILYQFWLFKDLEDHFKLAFTTESKSYPTTNNPTTMLIFLIIFPIYPIYIKYTLLHDHIETSKIKTEDNCALGLEAIFSFTLLCLCTLCIFPLVIEYRWQKAFNNHIIAHEQ